jgi:hypothetical protein
MARDFTEYALQKEQEFRETCSEPPLREEYSEEAGSGGTRGFVYANLPLSSDAYLKVYEKVVARSGGFHREVYCYALIIEGAHAEGWERDPTHPDEPVHAHEGDRNERTRKPFRVVSYQEALEMAWEIVTERERAPWVLEPPPE